MVRLDDVVRHQALDRLDFLVVEPSSDQTFDSIQCILWVSNSLSLCGHTDQTFAVSRERNNGWCRTCTLRVFNDTCIPSFHDGDTGVGCT
mmetsp:Transcript_46707/g.113820  ORF Transcript_46707/g.113820 Transcript_46707/m.113820 type:complete len:90 (-) Transcript_46707:239-508(-)